MRSSTLGEGNVTASAGSLVHHTSTREANRYDDGEEAATEDGAERDFPFLFGTSGFLPIRLLRF